MTGQTLTQLHQSSSALALPGTWKLGAGQAITLQPAQGGAVRVAHGQLWATYDGPHGGSLNDQGDLVVGTGEQLWVKAGQRIVIQAWDRKAPAYFSWDPAVTPSMVRTVNLASVLQPLADLRLALAFGVGAFGRLAGGVARLAWDVVAVRSRETLVACADCAATAHSKARRAHGAMS
jgi:hypothetical protein